MGLAITLPNNGWRPRFYQLPLWNFLARGGRRAIAIWHRRAGKDEVILHFTATALMQKPAVYWHMLPLQTQARKAIWTAVNPHTGMRRIDEAFPKALRRRTLENEMAIEFINGSLWQVVGSDKYNALMGTPPHGIVFSEWALSNATAWSYLAPILRENGGWAVFITTPRGRNHAYSMYKMGCESDTWFAEVASIEDTGTLTAADIEEERLEYVSLHGIEAADALIDQEYYCSFTAAILGAFWGKEMAKAEQAGQITHVRQIEGQPVHTAWDIGVDDSTAIWFFQVNYNKILILNYYEASGHGADHYAEKKDEFAMDHGYAYGDDWVPHDAKVREWGNAGKTRIQSMLELGLNPRVVPDHSKMDGINAARTIIPKCVWDEVLCEDGVECLRQYQAEYDDKHRVFKRTPLHNWASHGADAFIYLAVAHDDIDKPPDQPDGPRDPQGRLVPQARPGKAMKDMTFDEFDKAIQTDVEDDDWS